MFAKVLRDLAHLPPNARRIDVEAAVWRSVTRHTSAVSADRIAEITWQILRDLAGVSSKAA